MLNLNDREWKAFAIKDIFFTEQKKTAQVPTGAYVHKSKLHKGTIPRITVTSFNNGVDGYYTSTDKNYRVFNNFISVSFLGTVFYHPYEASIDMKVHCLQLINKDLDTYISKFLITAIKQSISNASYGDQLSSTDLPNKMILLPTIDGGQPDYAFMEQYIKEREDKLIQKYIDFIGKLPIEALPNLEEKTYKEFAIADIFDIKAGKRLTTADMDSGNVPFIGATELNNGVTNWINTPNETLDHNVLGVNYNGSVAEAFYHPYSCVFSDDVKRLHLKNADDGKYILLFCSMLIRKQKNKYTYGYKFNANRMARQKILLPTTDDGSPDYEYMEQYTKSIMYRKLTSYLSYVQKQHHG